MPNAEALNLLFPLELAGALPADHAVAGAALDRAEAARSALLAEIFPATASLLLTRWEALLAIIPGADETLQQRRDRVVARLRARGSLTLAYFEDLAAAMGISVTIHENIGNDPYKWGVELPTYAAHYFRAGSSCAGERLAVYATAVSLLKNLFDDLKPAHTKCDIPYIP